MVKIANIPQGLDPNGKTFYLDVLLDRVIPLLYQGALVRPNLLCVPTLAVSNWWVNRKVDGIDAGGVSFLELPGAPRGTRVPVLDRYDLAIAQSSSIPFGLSFQAGNVTATGLYDAVGDLITS